MTCDYPTLNARASRIAATYGWLEPAIQLKQGTVPDGFRASVVRAIAEFEGRGTFYNWDNERDDIYHAGQLVRLRKLVAKMRRRDRPPITGVVKG